MKVYVIANQKGGIGKTTTATALASILDKRGHKTLFIDADPQGNSTDTYKAASDNVATLYDVILEDDGRSIPLMEAVQHTENGDIVASDKLLTRGDIILSGQINGMERLKTALSAEEVAKTYEYVVIDTAPALDQILYNCLIAADEIIIPVTTDRYAIAGLLRLHNTIEEVRKRMNPNLKTSGLLFVMYDERTKLSKTAKDFLDQISERMETPLFETAIRRSIKAREAQSRRQLLINYSPCCTTERDYEAFVDVLTGEEW